MLITHALCAMPHPSRLSYSTTSLVRPSSTWKVLLVFQTLWKGLQGVFECAHRPCMPRTTIDTNGDRRVDFDGKHSKLSVRTVWLTRRFCGYTKLIRSSCSIQHSDGVVR